MAATVKALASRTSLERLVDNLEAGFFRAIAAPERALERELGSAWSAWASLAVDALEQDRDPFAALDALGIGLAVRPLRARALAAMNAAVLLVRDLVAAAKGADDFTIERVRYAEEMSLTRARGFQEAQKAVIRRELQAAAEAGRNPRAAAKDIREALGGTIGKSRARTIARTELHAAASWAQWQEVQRARQSTGADFLKEWRSSHDARTRPTHAAANGQRIALEASFLVGGAALRYPGDPLGPGREVINCRCTAIFVPARLANRIPQARPIVPEPMQVTLPPSPSAPSLAPPENTGPRAVPSQVFGRLVIDDDAARVLGIQATELPALTETLFGMLPDLREAEVDVSSRGLAVRISARHTNNRYLIQRDFQRRRQGSALIVRHTLFKLSPDFQGSGVAGRMLQAAVSEYRRLGAAKIDLFANLDVGGYAWGRYGFSPSSPTEFRKTVRANATVLGAADRRLVNALVKETAAKDLAWALSRLVNENGDRIGKRIMLGSSWGAELDLTDDVAVQTLSDELAGKAKK